MPGTPDWFSRDLHLGISGDDVRDLQLCLGMARTGIYDEPTGLAVRGLQRAHGLRPTGLVDRATADILGSLVWYRDDTKALESHKQRGSFGYFDGDLDFLQRSPEVSGGD